MMDRVSLSDSPLVVTAVTVYTTNGEVSVGVPQIVPFVTEICNPFGSEGVIDHDTAASPTV